MARRGDGRGRRCAACPACRPGLGKSPHLPAARGRARVGRLERRRLASSSRNTTAPSPPSATSCRRRAAAPAGPAAASPSWRSAPAMCAPLNTQIERMERNLEALERKRVALSGGGGSKRDRARILASLDANNCRDTEVAEREPPRRNGSSLFERLFGSGVPEGLPAEEPERQPFERAAGRATGAPARRGARGPRQRHPHPQPERRDLGPRPGRRVRHHVRAHLRRLLFSDVAHFVVGRFRPRPEELRIHLPRHRDAALLPARRRRGIGDDDLSRHRRALCVAADRLSLPRCGDVAAARLRLQPGAKNFSIVAGETRAAGRTCRAGDPDAGRDARIRPTIRRRWPIAKAGSTSTRSSAS